MKGFLLMNNSVLEVQADFFEIVLTAFPEKKASELLTDLVSKHFILKDVLTNYARSPS